MNAHLTGICRATAVSVVLLAAAPALAADWAPNVNYAVNARATFSGIVFEVVQAHRSQSGWEPPAVPALWRRPLPTGISLWASQTRYAVGSEVVFEGRPYKAVQGHQSVSTWTPPATPALWQRTCVNDEVCAADKLLASLSNLPATAIRSQRVALADLVYQETKLSAVFPRLGSPGSADPWGLSDRIEVVITENAEYDDRIVTFYRNGQAQLSSHQNGGTVTNSGSPNLAGALSVLAFVANPQTRAAWKPAIAETQAQWLVDRFDLPDDQTPPIIPLNWGCWSCRGHLVLGAAGVGAGAAGVAALLGWGASASGALGAGAGKFADELFGHCDRWCAVGECDEQARDCGGVRWWDNQMCSDQYEACCQMVGGAKITKGGEFIGCSAEGRDRAY